MKDARILIVFLAIAFAAALFFDVILMHQDCVKERCQDIVHPAVRREAIPAHQDLRPSYNFFLKHWEIHSVSIAEKPAWTDPAWTETHCECVAYGVSMWDRWMQR